MLRAMILILIPAIILVISCAQEPHYPKPATVHLTGVQIGTGLFAGMKRVNRACTFPGGLIKKPDGDSYYLEHGDEVLILEQDLGCIAPKGGASKVRAAETGLEGWLPTMVLREK